MNSQIKRSIKFSLTIAVITFVLATIFSVISSSILSKVVLIVGMIVVIVIVAIGVIFDMLGIASTSADEAPFHAMAAKNVPGAKMGRASCRKRRWIGVVQGSSRTERRE